MIGSPMKPFVCIHGHFYQPPRENPWLEEIELQDSAYPFHDWNQRITRECYEPNSASRILDKDGNIAKVFNNYAHMSFNFGPTLLSWMERKRPETYRAILDADRQSRDLFSGHGSALAQAYGHLILPLANQRDKQTQVIWGIRDFEHRFGRPPEGMWLSETAVDTETLETLAAQGIRFTILAPHQAEQVRLIKGGAWHELHGPVDPRVPYLCNLPSGRSLCLFFYDGAISQDIAFSNLLDNGENFAHRLIGSLSPGGAPQLAHVATDGETYGHHRRFGDMALAYGLDHIIKSGKARLTVYGEFLKLYPPQHEVRIRGNTSWSCAHGVERWRSDCGCRTGGLPGWNQAWRGPLRAALDWLRDRLIPVFESELRSLVSDPWIMRDAYIEVILDRGDCRLKAFLKEHTGRELDQEEIVRVLQLLEMQRQAMQMYTSCGWFFDEVSGLEGVQILSYAARAIQLATSITGQDLEPGFIEMLEAVPSNIAKWGNAAKLYRAQVQPGRLDLRRVAAHHAIASNFRTESLAEASCLRQIHCYSSEDLGYSEISSGQLRLTLGHTRIRSRITHAAKDFSYGVLYFGGYNVTAGIGSPMETAGFVALEENLQRCLDRSDIAESLRLLDHQFGTDSFTLWHLFRDEQRAILNTILSSTLTEIEESFRDIYRNQLSLLRFLREVSMPIPPQLALPIEVVFNSRLRQLLEADHFDAETFTDSVEELETLGLRLDRATLEFFAAKTLNSRLSALLNEPQNRARLRNTEELLAALAPLPLTLDLWEAQNIFLALLRRMDQANQDESTTATIGRCGEYLHVKVHQESA